MNTNSFRNISALLNGSLLFQFLNTRDEQITPDYVFKALKDYYCGINPTALANSYDIQPTSRRKIANHIRKNKNSGLRPTQRKIKKIKKVLEQYKNQKEYIKIFNTNLKKTNDDRTHIFTFVEGFSPKLDIVTLSTKQIDSFGPNTLIYLNNLFKKYRSEKSFIEIKNEIIKSRNRIRAIIEESNRIYNSRNDLTEAHKEVELFWNKILNSKNNLELSNSLEFDLMNIIKNISELSQRDSELGKRLKVCKFKNSGCIHPYFYAKDTAQTTCMSKKCQKRNRK